MTVALTAKYVGRCQVVEQEGMYGHVMYGMAIKGIDQQAYWQHVMTGRATLGIPMVGLYANLHDA